jgi:hypothetical protein
VSSLNMQVVQQLSTPGWRACSQHCLLMVRAGKGPPSHQIPHWVGMYSCPSDHMPSSQPQSAPPRVGALAHFHTLFPASSAPPSPSLSHITPHGYYTHLNHAVPVATTETAPKSTPATPTPLASAPEGESDVSCCSPAGGQAESMHCGGAE